MYIKALLNIVDSNQGTFFKHFGCESTHFVQTLWMKSKEFIQTSWMRIRSIWCNRFECTARLCSNSLDAKEGLLKKKSKSKSKVFVQTCWCESTHLFEHVGCKAKLLFKHVECKKRHLFKHFGCEGSYLLTFWMRTKAFVQTLWMKSKELLQKSWIRSKGICSNALDAQQALFKQSGCEGRHLQKQPILFHHFGYESTRLFKDFGCKNKPPVQLFPKHFGFQALCCEYFGCKAKHLLLHFGPEPKAYVRGCKASICKNRQKKSLKAKQGICFRTLEAKQGICWDIVQRIANEK